MRFGRSRKHETENSIKRAGFSNFMIMLNWIPMKYMVTHVFGKIFSVLFNQWFLPIRSLLLQTFREYATGSGPNYINISIMLIRCSYIHSQPPEVNERIDMFGPRKMLVQPLCLDDVAILSI